MSWTIYDDTGKPVISQGDFSITITGDTGTDTITDGETIDFEGGSGIGTVVTSGKVAIAHKYNYTITLGSSDAFDIDLTLLTGYTGAKSMILTFALRGTVSANTDITVIQLNADTTATNYYYQRADAQDAVASVTEANTNTGILQNVTAATSPTSSWTVGRITFDNPLNTSQLKVGFVSAYGRYDTAASRTTNTGFDWRSTSAITSIRIRTDNHPTDLFASGSFVNIEFIT